MTRLAVALLAALFVTGGSIPSAHAIPVTYIAEGTLDLESGSDFALLEGAVIRVVVTADTEDAPTAIFGQEAHYSPSSAAITFADRPGEAADITLPYNPLVGVINAAPASNSADRFQLFAAFFALEGNEVDAGDFKVDFIDPEFFPGTQPGALPLFSISEVLGLSAGTVDVIDAAGSNGFAVYRPSALSVTAVPEPSTQLLFGVALTTLAALARRKVV